MDLPSDPNHPINIPSDPSTSGSKVNNDQMTKKRIYTFPSFNNEFSNSCKRCMDVMNKFPSHPFCGPHSLCRNGLDSWTPENCPACIAICNEMINKHCEPIEVKINMFRALSNILHKIQKFTVQPKKWVYLTPYYLSFKRMCYTHSPSITSLPQLLSSEWLNYDSDNSNDENTLSESQTSNTQFDNDFNSHSLDNLTATFPISSNSELVDNHTSASSFYLDPTGSLVTNFNISYIQSQPSYVSSHPNSNPSLVSSAHIPSSSIPPLSQVGTGTQPSVTSNSSYTDNLPTSTFPSKEWLPQAGSKVDTNTGITWNCIQLTHIVSNDILTDSSNCKVKFAIQLHPEGSHFYIKKDLSTSGDDKDNDDRVAEMLVKEAFNKAVAFTEEKGWGKKLKSLRMTPHNRNIFINTPLVDDLKFSPLVLSHIFSVKNIEGIKIPLKEFPDNSDSFSFAFKLNKDIVNSDELMWEVFHDESLDGKHETSRLTFPSSPSLDSKLVAEEKEARGRFLQCLSCYTGQELLSVSKEVNQETSEFLKVLSRNSAPLLFFHGSSWVKKKVALRKNFFANCNSTSFSNDLINSSVWCKGLFPSSLLEEVRANAVAAGQGNLLRALSFSSNKDKKPKQSVSSYTPKPSSTFGSQSHKRSNSSIRFSNPPAKRVHHQTSSSQNSYPQISQSSSSNFQPFLAEKRNDYSDRRVHKNSNYQSKFNNPQSGNQGRSFHPYKK